MRNGLTLIFLLVAQLCSANMASPTRRGTLSSAAFSSRDIDILREQIRVTISNDFKSASYVINYFIRTETAGLQVPLLFHAKDYLGNFKVWVDDKEVTLLDIPYQYRGTDSSFNKFSGSFKSATPDDDMETEIQWDAHSSSSYKLKDLKYFETSLSKGEHNIRVEYIANAWIDRSNWVNEYSFRYSLSPARHWKSFGSLEITLNAPSTNGTLSTNISAPTSGDIYSAATWQFSKLPADFLEFEYHPKLNSTAKAMIKMSPTGMCIIIGMLLASLHFLAIYKYRRSHAERKYSPIVIAGSMVVPFLALLSYILLFDLIDAAIGPEASRYHGYTFMVMVFYPLLLPCYWGISWVIDRVIKSKYRYL
jgi:hypothetical protein